MTGVRKPCPSSSGARDRARCAPRIVERVGRPARSTNRSSSQNADTNASVAVKAPDEPPERAGVVIAHGRARWHSGAGGQSRRGIGRRRLAAPADRVPPCGRTCAAVRPAEPLWFRSAAARSTGALTRESRLASPQAVVLESDDWGLCAWVPDEQAYRVLAGQPAFRSEAGQRYGRSTLESAHDVQRLAALLLEFRGGDGCRRCGRRTRSWPRRTGAPRAAALRSRIAAARRARRAHGRWQRPGLLVAVRRAEESGVVGGAARAASPARARVAARAAARPARRAPRSSTRVRCASRSRGAASTTRPSRARSARARAARGGDALHGALRAHADVVRLPGLPLDDDWLEGRSRIARLTTLQGKPEQSAAAGRRCAAAGLGCSSHHERRAVLPAAAHRVRAARRRRVARPDRRRGRAPRRARGVGRGRPAVLSSHRLNYAHLDEPWSEASGPAARPAGQAGGPTARCSSRTSRCGSWRSTTGPRSLGRAGHAAARLRRRASRSDPGAEG